MGELLFWWRVLLGRDERDMSGLSCRRESYQGGVRRASHDQTQATAQISSSQEPVPDRLRLRENNFNYV